MADSVRHRGAGRVPRRAARRRLLIEPACPGCTAAAPSSRGCALGCRRLRSPRSRRPKRPSTCASRRCCRAASSRTIGYLQSFPHLAGSVFSFEGDEAGRGRAGARAPSARGLERVPGDDRAGARAGGLLPGLSGDRRARPAAAGRRHRRRRRRLGVPPRALRGPGAAADLPPARDRPARRARGRARLARRVAQRGLELLRAARPRRRARRRQRPVLRPRRAHARRQPARAGAEVRAAGADRRAPSRRRWPRSTTTRTTSLRTTGSSSMPAAATGPPTRPASASVRSGSCSRCCATTASTRTPGPRTCARSCGTIMARTRAAQQPARASTRRLPSRTPCTGAERTYAESNCYTDIIIELAARAAAMSRWRCSAASCAMDFEGDQWTFFKPPPGGLERLFGIDIHEMQPYRPLPQQIAEQIERGAHDDRRARLLVPARHRRDQLPQRARQDARWSPRRSTSRRRRCATSTVPAVRARTARTTAGSSGSGASTRPDVLPPYTELVRFDAGPRLEGEELRAAARAAAAAPSRAGARPTTRSSASARSSPPSCRRCWRRRPRTTTPTRSRRCGWSAPPSSSAPPTSEWLLRRGGGRRRRPRCGEIVDGCKVLCFRLARRREFDPAPADRRHLAGGLARSGGRRVPRAGGSALPDGARERRATRLAGRGLRAVPAARRRAELDRAAPGCAPPCLGPPRARCATAGELGAPATRAISTPRTGGSAPPSTRRRAAAGEESVLRLDGLATVAEVYLNGELIGAESSRCSRVHAIAVGGASARARNELVICCRALAPLLRERGAGRAPAGAPWSPTSDLRFFRTMLLGRAPGFAPGPAVGRTVAPGLARAPAGHRGRRVSSCGPASRATTGCSPCGCAASVARRRPIESLERRGRCSPSVTGRRAAPRRSRAPADRRGRRRRFSGELRVPGRGAGGPTPTASRPLRVALRSPGRRRAGDRRGPGRLPRAAPAGRRPRCRRRRARPPGQRGRRCSPAARSGRRSTTRHGTRPRPRCAPRSSWCATRA